MRPTRIQFQPGELTQWLGYEDFVLVSPDGRHTVALTYEGEPPHGDSYHSTLIDGFPLPGLAWGGNFTFSRCSRYCVFSWMREYFERLTIVVNMDKRRYLVLSRYIEALGIEWPTILSADGQTCVEDEVESWIAF